MAGPVVPRDLTASEGAVQRQSPAQHHLQRLAWEGKDLQETLGTCRVEEDLRSFGLHGRWVESEHHLASSLFEVGFHFS